MKAIANSSHSTDIERKTGLLKQKIALTDAAGKTGLAQLASAIRQAMTALGQRRSHPDFALSLLCIRLQTCFLG